MSLMRLLPTAALIALLAAAVAHAGDSRPGPGAVFHVAPTGNDANPGQKERPFASIARAQAAARQRIAADARENTVAVILHAGTYFLKQPLAFGPQDTTGARTVTYTAAEGETVVVSGGRPITGWAKGKGEIWTVALPEAKAGKWTFRNLWVNGRRAVRARFPNETDTPSRVQLAASSLSKDLKAFTIGLDPKLVKDWANPGDIEVLVDGNWAINRKRVQSIDTKTGTLTMAPPHRKTIPWNQPRKGRWAYLENSPSFLDQPGEWVLDASTGTLSYWPLPGEDMAKAEIIAPVLTRLLEVKGTAQKPVRGLHFAGITFAHTDWTIPEVGYFGVQACHHVRGQGEARVWDRIPCALRFDYAEDCSVRDGAIAHMGTGGIEFVEHCRKTTLEGNHVFDISANGVMLGGPKDEEGVPKDCRIANNHVHATGIEYHGAIGIWVGFAQRAAVVHNEVHDTPYTGVSLGWQWNPQPTPCKENTVAFNHIYDVMKNLGDGGGIYTLGFQPGTVIRGNHIHDVRRCPFNQAAPNNGMFIDEGSKGFLFEGNLIYSTAHQPVRHNQNRSEWHTWKGNHFGRGPVPAPGKVGMALACDGSSVFLEAPHKPALDPEQLTVEAWIKLGELPGGRDPRRWIVNKNRNEWIEGNYALLISGSQAGAYLNIGGGRQNHIAAMSPEGALKPDTWHHMAMTYDGKDLKVYVDGKQAAATAVNKPRKPGSSPVAIGRRQDGYNYFRGLIDEVRIYSRALPAAEIAVHHEKAAKLEAPANEKLLAGYWSFDDLRDDNKAAQAITAKAGPEPPFRTKFGLGK